MKRTQRVVSALAWGLALGGAVLVAARAAPFGPTTRPTGPATRPGTQPARVIFQDLFTEGVAPSPDRWLVRNPDRQRVAVRQGMLVAHAEAKDRPTRVEFQAQEALPSLGKWTLEFDAVVTSLWGGGRGEVRVELRDFATRADREGTDFVLAERYWNEQSGLKFGLFHGGAFVGWHEVAPVGQLGAWHHYRVEYDAGNLTLWRDNERTLECDVASMLDRPLTEGVSVEMGFHVPAACGIEGCLDNVTITSPEPTPRPKP